MRSERIGAGIGTMRTERAGREIGTMRSEGWIRSAWGVAAPLPVVALIVVLFLPLTPSYDFDVFLHAGRAILHGHQVYPQVGSPAVYSGSSFVYPYFAALPFIPLAALSTDSATIVFFALQVLAVLAACLWATDRDPWRTTLVFCTAFLITGLQLGSLSPLLFAGAVALWRLRDRPIAMGLLAAPVVASKLFLAPLLAWPLLARRYRAFGWACGSTLALLVFSFLVGPLGPLSYMRILSALGLHEAHSGFGVIGGLRNEGFTPLAAQGTAAAIAVVLLAVAYLHYRRFGNEAILFCGAVAVSLLLTPVLWSHYLVLLPAALIALDGSRVSFLVLALASWVIAPPHGIKVQSDLLAGFKNLGPWLALAASLVLFGAAAASARRKTGQRGYG